MRVLITGGFGFVGGRVGQYLIECGYEVLLGSRKIREIPNWLPQAEAVQTDWNNNAALLDLCASVDIVIHAAGMNAQDCVSNPEQALAAALSSCHMMTFLALAAKMNWPVSGYTDNAVATLGKNSKGKMSVTDIELNPKIAFSKEFSVDENKMKEVQERAHRYCFIANSLSDEVKVKIN